MAIFGNYLGTYILSLQVYGTMEVAAYVWREWNSNIGVRDIPTS